MPRPIDASSLNPGRGRLAQKTVEDSSLKNPNRDSEPLRTHVDDPSRAHMAQTIGIIDAGDCYVSDEVEGALQEICGGASAGRLNGLVAGGRFDEVLAGLPTASLTLTLESAATTGNDTIVIIGAASFTASGLTVNLLANQTQYIYLDTNSANPTYRQLVTSAAPPEIETSAGVEDILFAEVTTNATGVTEYTDARFFVRNLDRKVTYSSRQGEDVDSWSEGCFATLQACFFWINNYGAWAGTGEETKGTVFVRGQHVLDAPLQVISSYLRIQGDGLCSIETSATFSGSSLLDLSGCGNLVIEGIEFLNSPGGGGAALTYCIYGKSSSKMDSLVVQNCYVNNTGRGFETAIFLEHDLGFGTAFIQDNVLECDENAACVSLRGYRRSHVVNNEIRRSSLILSTLTTIGIELLNPNSDVTRGNDDIVISGNYITNFGCGVCIEYSEGVKVVDNFIEDCGKGVESEIGTANAVGVPTTTDVTVENNTIILDEDYGVGPAISFTEATELIISGNNIKHPQTDFSAYTPGFVPKGISVSSDSFGVKFGLNGVPLNATISENTVAGFLDRATGVGRSLEVVGEGLNSNTAAGVSVTGNTFVEGPVLISDSVVEFVVSDNNIGGYLDEASAVQLNAPPALSILGTANGRPGRGLVSGNEIYRFGDGIAVVGAGPLAFAIRKLEITNNQIRECFHTQDNRTDSFSGIGSKGIGLYNCQDVKVQGNSVRNIGQSFTNQGINISPQGNVWTVGIYARNSQSLSVLGNVVERLQSNGAGSAIGVFFGFNDDGTGTDYDRFQVKGNTVLLNDDNVPSRAGIWFNNPVGRKIGFATVSENNVEAESDGVEYGIRFSALNLLTGDNLGGIFELCSVTSNKVFGVTENAIDFDTTSNTTQVNASALGQISVNHNTITCDGGNTIGVSINTEAENFLSSMIEVQVIGNVIHDAAVSAVRVRSLGGGPVATCRDVSIEGNEATNSATSAAPAGVTYRFQRSGVHDDDDANLSICRNLGVSGSGLSRGALEVDFGGSSFKNVVIDGNQLFGLEDTLGSAVLIEADGNGTAKTIRSLSFSDNQITTDTGDAGGNDGVAVTFTDFTLFNFRIDNNRIAAASNSAASSYNSSLSITTSGTVSNPWLITGLSVTNNILSGGNLSINTDAGIAGWTIDGNNVSVAAFAAVSPDGAIDITATKNSVYALPLGVLDVSVSGNKTLYGGKGISWDFDEYESVTAVSLSDNQISLPRTGTVLDAGFGIYMTSTVETSVIRDFRVEDNQINGCEEGQHINLDLSSLKTAQIQGFSVSRNTCVGPTTSLTTTNAAIRVRAEVLVPSEITDLSIDGNKIVPSGDDYAERGIHFVGPTDTSNGTTNIGNISASGNKIDLLNGDGESGYGIFFAFDNDETTPYSVQNLRVDANEILFQNTASPGNIHGIWVRATCGLNAVSISGNNVRGFFDTGLSNGYGIGLSHDFSTTSGRETAPAIPSNVFIAGNDAAVAAAAPFKVNDVEFTPITWRNVTVSNNTVSWNTGYGTPAPLIAATYYGAMSIMNVREEIVLLSKKQVAVCMWGFVASGNNLRSTKGNLSGTLLTRGFVVRVLQADAQWNDGTSPASGSSVYFQRGWAITGNSASDFMFSDTSAGPGTSYGQGVTNIGSNLFDGVVEANFANDNDGTGGTPTGWNEIISTATTNVNNEGRRF